ncbi:MAG: UDP-N-acetylmuramoyl-L-alanyl-D-glutamate--2,6-diaminopimelate ligase [Syntrophomonadaceae bacterium]|nr:UDP-N-acetylmuramoyl-L-alanyl-D-glutamate--2,6-diaminopimelate ligase [Syntrophomonadaceae bacterium]
MKLRTLLQGLDYQLISGSLDKEIKGISFDSRQTRPGDLFICIPGLKTDGHDYIQQAVAGGAWALLVERKVDAGTDVAVVQVDDSRMAMPKAASNFHHKPSSHLRLVGVTGTNGKTTTTHLIQAILEEWGCKTGIMGTLYSRMGEYEKAFRHTTPESVDIEEFLALVRRQSGQYAVMEVSSHALDLGRVDQLEFHSAVFTNLTQDHLDYHGSMELYKQSKLHLFSRLEGGKGHFAVINADDPAACDFIENCTTGCVTYGIDKEAMVKAVDLESNLKGSHFTVLYQKKRLDINMKLIGRFSIYNALAAIAFGLWEGISPGVIAAALAKVTGVAGRFEPVDCGQDFTVIVDYAHTPDGLENILKTAREVLENRLITVFGCGGDRDRTKRPIMGRIVAQYSDFCIVTSDNPRSEDPEAIIDDIIPGLQEVENSHYAKIIDRREAIHQAICLAKKGDLIIIAGKGHETYQLIKDQVLDFDDRLVAAEFLKGKMNG